MSRQTPLADMNSDEEDVAQWRELLRDNGVALTAGEKVQLQQYLDALKSNPPSGTNGPQAADSGAQIQFPGPPTPAAPLGQLDEYDVLEELGSGAFGTVFRGFDRSLRREVAIKVLNPEHAAVHRDRQRFEQEARVVSSLQHDHVVRILDVSTASELSLPYLVMELVSGQSLAEHLAGKTIAKQGVFEPQEGARLVRQVALALGAAHAMGLVHRDIKSSNIMLDNSTGRAKLTDFGLARQVPDAGEINTRSGTVLGTLPYMSPEQVLTPEQVDARSDLYSLGVVLYELLTGERPFRGTSSALLVQAVHDDPQPLRRLNPAVPRDLETICLKCLAKEPAKRYTTAEALAEELQRFLAGEPILARPVASWERGVKWVKRQRVVAALLAAVVLVAILGFAGVTWQWARAEANLARAVDAATAAESSRMVADSAADAAETARQGERAERERVERLLYAHDVSLAYHEYLNHNALRAAQLLDGTPAALRNWEWRFLNRFCREEQLTLSGHRAVVRSVAFSPDGKLLASISPGLGFDRPGEVKVWDATTGAERFNLPGHAGTEVAVAFSPDGKRLVTTSARQAGGVRVWNVVDGREILAIPLDGHAFCVEFSPDGRLLAMGQHNGRVVLHDSASGAEVLSASRHKGRVFDLAFNRDGTLLASAAQDGAASIWNVSDGRKIHSVEGLGDARTVAFSPDSRQLAIGAWSGAVKILHMTAEGGREVPVRPLPSAVMQLRWRPDGKQLAVLTDDGALQLWDASTLGLERTFYGHHRAIAFSPNGRQLATAGIDQQVRLWDLTSPARQPSSLRVLSSTNQMTNMAFSRDSRSVAVANRDDGTLSLWDLSTRRVFKRFQGHRGAIACVAFSPDDRRLASSSADKTLKLWDVATQKNLRTFAGHAGVVTGVVFHPDGVHIVSASNDQTVKVWDMETGQEILTLEGRATENLCAASQAGGRTTAAASVDGVIQLWDADTGIVLAEWRGHDGRINGLAFDPKGRLLASCGDDALIQIWDVAATIGGQFEPHRVLRGHIADVTNVAFTPDGARLASASRDWTVKIWDARVGHELLSIRNYVAENARVRFSPDGRLLALSGKSVMYVWDSGDQQSRLASSDQPTDTVQETVAWHGQEAQACEKAEHWFGAAFHWQQLASLEPHNWRHLERRGNAHAGLEEWDQAAADFDRAAALGADARVENRRALLRLRAGDNQSYRAICAGMLDAFGGTEDGSTANLIAWTCALSSESAVDPDRLVLLAELAVAGRRTNTYLNTLGAALCRAGRFHDAVSTLAQAIEVHRDGGTVDDWIFLAIANQSLGRTDEARQWFDKSARWIDQAIEQQAPGGRVVTPLSWSRQIELRVLRREAEELLSTERAVHAAPHE